MHYIILTTRQDTYSLFEFTCPGDNYFDELYVH